MNSLELKNIRKELRYSQLEMSEKLGITLSGYQKYEYGNRKIPETVRKLLDNIKDQENTIKLNIPSLKKDGVKFNIGEAIELIINNIEEAEKHPIFAMYIKTVYQEGALSNLNKHNNLIDKMKSNG